MDTDTRHSGDGAGNLMIFGLMSALIYLLIMAVTITEWDYGFGGSANSVPLLLLIHMAICVLIGAIMPFMLSKKLWNDWGPDDVAFTWVPFVWLTMFFAFWVAPLVWLYSITH